MTRPVTGFTLIELIVSLTILTLIVGLSTVAVAAFGREPVASPRAMLGATHLEAITSGAPVLTPPDSGSLDSSGPLFLPDGQAIGAGVDALTGEPEAGPTP